MESKTATARKMIAFIEAGKTKELEDVLSDDFEFSGLVPGTMDKGRFLKFMQALKEAIPGWKFNMSRVKEEGNTVRMQFYAMGTNTGELNIPSAGLKSVPATHKNVVLPVQPAEIVIKNGTVDEFRISVVPGGDMEGILKQLGIEPSKPTRV